MSEVNFGAEIIEIKNHTAAMMQVITSIRQETSQRLNDMDTYFQAIVKSNVEIQLALTRKNEELIKSNAALVSLNKKGFKSKFFCLCITDIHSRFYRYRHDALFDSGLKAHLRQFWIK